MHGWGQMRRTGSRDVVPPPQYSGRCGSRCARERGASRSRTLSADAAPGAMRAARTAVPGWLAVVGAWVCSRLSCPVSQAGSEARKITRTMPAMESRGRQATRHSVSTTDERQGRSVTGESAEREGAGGTRRSLNGGRWYRRTAVLRIPPGALRLRFRLARKALGHRSPSENAVAEDGSGDSPHRRIDVR